jgi:rod shape-determining protein MreC
MGKKSAWITSLMIVSMSFFLLYHMFSISPRAIVYQTSSVLLYPFLKIQSTFMHTINNWLQQRSTVQELYGVIATLRAEKDTAVAENIELQSSLAHYKDVNELVQFNKRYVQTGYIAQVLLKHLSSREHFFLVEGGFNQGITKDMVATYKGNLIGRVIEVYPWYSKVQLITDASCQVAAYSTRTRAQGIHKGVYNEHESALDYVSHLDRLGIDDLVVSSGEGLVFPQGFALGKVSHCVMDGLYQQVKVKPIVDFRSIKYCTLLAKSK